MEQIKIPLIKDTKLNRVIATAVAIGITTGFGYAARLLHEIDQSSQRTEVQITRFLEWRANNDEHKRDIEARIDNLALMVVAQSYHKVLEQKGDDESLAEGQGANNADD
jgi:hypothetical protein